MSLYEILLIVYLIVAIALIGFVLLQQGKGAEMGASFGAGGSNTVFGSGGSGNFMTRTTAILATVFFIVSLTIGSITANRDKSEDEFENLEVPLETQQEVPSSDIPSSDIPASDDADEGDVPPSDDTPN